MDDLDPLAPQSDEVLTQAEVERLLAEVAAQESQTTIVKSAGAVETRPKDSIHTYDFRHPVFLSANELRRLRVEHEEIIRRLGALLSIYLRVEFGLQMSKLQTMPYHRFTEGITNPAHLVLFKVEPLRGICVLDVNARLALTIVDRLMGGAGHSVTQDRELSEIEAALLDQAVQIIVGEWCNHWQQLQELRPVTLGHESNGLFLQTAHSDTVMLVVTMEARMGDCMEPIQLAFPFATLEPLIRQLNQKLRTEVSSADQSAAQKPKWNPALETIPVPLSAEWPEVKMSARDLANLKVGDVIPLDADVLNNVCLRLSTHPKFTGRLGTQDGKWAVEITKPVKS